MLYLQMELPRLRLIRATLPILRERFALGSIIIYKYLLIDILFLIRPMYIIVHIL